MTNHPRKAFDLTLSDGTGRETERPSTTFVSIGDLVERIVRTVGTTRLRNDNEPGEWGAAENAQPRKKVE